MTDGSDTDLIMLEYQRFMQGERGPLASTISKYDEVVHRFLPIVFRTESFI